MTSFSDYFLNYWNSWAIELMVIIILFVVALRHWRGIARLTMTHTLLLAVLIWLGGIVIYSIGLAYDGSGGSLTAFLLRAAQASLGMFISNNELTDVSAFYKGNTPYMIAFTLIHMSAIFLSAIFVLNTIGYRIRNYFQMRHIARMSSGEDEATHFFWGLTDESFAMAEDIRRHYPADRIIFLRSTADSEIGSRLEVKQIIGSSAASRNSLALRHKVEAISDALVFYVPDGSPWLSNRSIRKLTRNSRRLRFYTFTQDEKHNLKLGGDVFNDPELGAAKDKDIRINTLASRGGKNRIVEDYVSMKMSEGHHIRWNILDRPYLAVRALSLNAAFHPVTSLRSDAICNGAIKGGYVAVVIGFGKMGQQLFRHLYEFSSFVGPDGKPAPRQFLIVDPDINGKAGQLCISNPSFFHTPSISLIAAEPGSVEFWRALREHAGHVNSIGITLDNDETNLDIAMDIYRGVLQYSPERPQNLKLFLQMCSAENDVTIRQLCNNYNHEKDLTGMEIVPFGSVRDIFNCDTVMASDILRHARMFNYNFDLLRGVNTDCTPTEAWKKDYSIRFFMERYKFAPLALEMYYSSVTQCNADCSHIGTLLALAGVAADDVQTLGSYVEAIHRRDPMSCSYPGASRKFQEMMDNLARCAHNRLVTSNWLFGYRPLGQNKGEVSHIEAARQKLTRYMTPWEECDSVTRLLAYTVVDTSFVIAYNNATQSEGGAA